MDVLPFAGVVLERNPLEPEEDRPEIGTAGEVARPGVVVSVIAFHGLAASLNPAPGTTVMTRLLSGGFDLRDFVLFGRHWFHSTPVPVESTTWGRIKATFSK